MDTLPDSERAALEARLDAQRQEIVGLLSDIDDAAARTRLVPSLTTVLGLVKHATFAEAVWFQHRVAGASRAELGLPDDVTESWVLDPLDTVETIRAGFLTACERSREIAAAHDLDEQFPWYERSVNLRYIYGHMIAELARHAGHGDILVEQLKAGASG
ncbi:DinB family protein [Sporichthya sp.]|uniref:DinB family protein n=1 Tax=Sporichthya sp. TaxID=65475 RepID=UPI0018460D11|nr:DinB family protein [Sporichthya sp.]MBA3744076.1 DinB family protein [Sporichthya sp.]